MNSARVRADGLPNVGDELDRRGAAAPEDVDVLARRGAPAVYIVDEFLNVLYFREDPKERRNDCRMPKNGTALPPLIERTAVGLLRRTLSEGQGNDILTAVPAASVAVRLVSLGGVAGSAYAIF